VISPKVLALAEGVLKAMFLTKIRLVSAAILVVSIGTGLADWSYRATAQTIGTAVQPAAQGQLVPVTGQLQSPSQAQTTTAGQPLNVAQRGLAAPAERPAADELDALRLEIDALRKEVRATRDRVRVLEAELHGRTQTPANVYQNQPGTPANVYLGTAYGMPQTSIGGPQETQACNLLIKRLRICQETLWTRSETPMPRRPSGHRATPRTTFDLLLSAGRARRTLSPKPRPRSASSARILMTGRQLRPWSGPPSDSRWRLAGHGWTTPTSRTRLLGIESVFEVSDPSNSRYLALAKSLFLA
jgi:hypothetical protein